MFVGVAQPADLHDIPAGSPDNPENPYYRTHDVELWFGSADDFIRYLTLVQDHIRDLVRRVNALNGLEPQSETVFGYPEAEASAMSLFHCPRCPFAVKDFVRICPTCPFVEAVRAKQAGT